MTCNITGAAITPDGAVLASATLRFTRNPKVPGSQGGAVIMPRAITTTTDVAGLVDFDIEPGNYIGTDVGSGANFDFAVADTASADFADCVDAAAVDNISDLTGGTMNVAFSNVVINGFLNVGPRVTATIAGGEVTVTATRTKLATENDDLTDDLRVINGGTDGDVLILSTGSAARDVVLKHRTGGSDNLLLLGSADQSLNHSSDGIWLIYRGTDARWLQVTPLADLGV